MVVVSDQRSPTHAGGYTESVSTRSKKLKNPFKRHPRTGSSDQTSAPSRLPPPPAYSAHHAGTNDGPAASTHQKPASLFSWNSGRVSWRGFGSLKGRGKTVDGDPAGQTKAHPALPSSSDRIMSTWKRRQNRHGVLEFEFQPPFVVELDPPAHDSSRPPSRLPEPVGQPFPSRATYSPSPIPAVPLRPPEPLYPSARPATDSPASSYRTAPSLPRKPTEERLATLKAAPTSPASSSVQASPELDKHALSSEFPLPPARRPSSAELVKNANGSFATFANGLPTVVPVPNKSLLSPPRTAPTARYTSSNLPRPKNGPFTAANPYPAPIDAHKSRLPIPSTASTLTTSSSPRSSPRLSLRKPIQIPARPRGSPPASSARVSSLLNSDVEARPRTSWASSNTATRSSSVGSDDTLNSPRLATPIDPRKRTSLVIPVVAVDPEPSPTLETQDSEQGRTQRTGHVDTEEERRRFEREVEDEFSEKRMQDLLRELGI
ncbi:uncharacterized protein JCM15063_006586 [Sporobolomyces koalae]|uniref:uncharacterized protein n=1 Tax=Sporobolomyces koalae TaxID=500713 RepID=UPI003177B0EE